MRKAKSKTVKTNGRPYNSPNISEGMKKWWKKRKAAQAATARATQPSIKSAPKRQKSPSRTEQLHTVQGVLEGLLVQIKIWQRTP